MCALNDPLGQAHQLAITILTWKLFWLWKVGTDVQTPSVKIVITTGRDRGSVWWIKKCYGCKIGIRNKATLILLLKMVRLIMNPS